MPAIPAQLHAPGEAIDGFTVRSVDPVPEVRGRAYRIDHRASGARILHVHCDDPENLFSINFPTPPPDDTGLPHILEHVVLAGSKRFPVREPFFEMLKMSMATFINAMTAPDCTYYPVASNTRKDLFNLAEVYFDAVFHPLLTEDSFKREGHHLAPADPDDPSGALSVTGIVYNEMKGAYSSPLARLHRDAMRKLLPDTIYGRSSGGEPEAIPDLTYDSFRRYHADHYQPGNAYFFLYGDIPTRDYLDFLSDRLAGLTSRPPVIDLGLQARWSAARHFDDTYPIEPGESTDGKTYLLLAWLAADATDVDASIEWYLLDTILLGHEAAPLRKAIIDSGIGADMVSSGAFPLGREIAFAVGVKDSEADRRERFTELVVSTLSDIADRGVTAEEVSTALQQATYHYQEIQPMFPLHTLDRVIDAWIYGMDPLTFLRLGEHLEAFRQRYRDDPTLFERLIREQVLANPHRLSICLCPDPEMQEQTDAAFTERMSALRDTFSDADTEQIAEQAAALQRSNSQPNSPDAVARLPQLAVGDLPDEITHIDTAVGHVDGVALLRTDVFANGVNYLALSFDLVGLPAELWPFMPRYTSALRKLGAAGQDYAAIARRTAATTGGIGAGTGIGCHAEDPDRPVWRLTVRLKALDDQIEPALELLRDLLFEVDPGDRDRLREVMVQTRSRCRTQLVHQGLGTAQTYAARGMSEGGYLHDLMGGLPQLDQSEEVAGAFDEHADALIERIESIRDFLLNRERLAVSFTGSDAAFDLTSAALASWIASMPAAPVVPGPTGFEPLPPSHAGLAGPIQVAHCAKVLPAPPATDPAEAPLRVGAHLIRMDYLLPEVRFKGNAYGASFSYDPRASRAAFGSYRDPHVARTLGVFDATDRYVADADWSQLDIDRAIIATAKDDFRPVRPSQATGAALQRHLGGTTPELQQRRYESLRRVTPRAVKEALADLLAPSEQTSVCVVSSRQKLEQANQELEQPLDVRDILRPGAGAGAGEQRLV